MEGDSDGYDDDGESVGEIDGLVVGENVGDMDGCDSVGAFVGE
jgi:hypothetical protein